METRISKRLESCALHVINSAVNISLYSGDKSLPVAQTVDNGASNKIDNVYIEYSFALDKIVYQLINVKAVFGRLLIKCNR